MLLLLPGELILQVFSYLDYPDLALLSKLSQVLARLASDPALLNNRIRVITPARVNHDLFGLDPRGDLLRPSVGDLVQRGVIRGLAIERRWRAGSYFYSHTSVRQYETALLLARQQACHVLSTHLRRRGANDNPLMTLLQAQVYPDVESATLRISRSLLPVMRQLKFSLQRDKLARLVRDGSGMLGVGKWIENNGRVVRDGERVRLAICPNVRQIASIYEARK
ncbi:hypothetical protein FB45DRAFT_804190 [Roridomyces roridus]|uniref:F-box domain-containing protein n=1 Tax=Roridomyces roridus TaxID=1738132 RepID=A0AAD7FCG1_9AGAR|nr:hypothetical protein FB45DRAFT_804190 [Roridomyces roridus]